MNVKVVTSSEIAKYANQLEQNLAKGKKRLDCIKTRQLVDDFAYYDLVDRLLDSLEDVTLGKEVVRFLIICSFSEFKSTRDSATQLLGKSCILRKDVLNALRSRLGDSWWVVRCSAMYSLSQLKAQEYTGEIIGRYTSWSFIEREWVLRSLTILGDPKASDFLLKTFKLARSMNIKYLAAGALSAIGLEEHETFLKNRIAVEKDIDLKETLESVFEMLGELRGCATGSLNLNVNGVSVHGLA